MIYEMLRLDPLDPAFTIPLMLFRLEMDYKACSPAYSRALFKIWFTSNSKDSSTVFPGWLYIYELWTLAISSCTLVLDSARMTLI
jgi:hypothetical protein